MQKAIAEDTGINYHRFVRFLHASANFKRMNEQKKREKERKNPLVSFRFKYKMFYNSGLFSPLQHTPSLSLTSFDFTDTFSAIFNLTN